MQGFLELFGTQRPVEGGDLGNVGTITLESVVVTKQQPSGTVILSVLAP